MASSSRRSSTRCFPFAQAKEALVYLENGRAKGKVVVELGSDVWDCPV
ncbi:zinc-binding dehydrogenase [Bradyrhizobium sp. 21]|nr:zinc-binding dehydrogenase [Bradyrhizobium sp. 21]MCK1385666.1 zinc-binding dehydrogenase [Bradyrhizobium sp. 21]